MNCDEKKCQELREAVERFLGIQLNTKTDFERLSGEIFKHKQTLISSTTLRRFWGYQEQDAHHTSKTTLNLLSRLVGYTSWDAFISDSGRTDESQFLGTSKSLLTSNLNVGARVVVSWNPDRVVTLEYIGGDVFRVLESQNSKLQAKDTFHCQQFVEGMPLICEGLIREDHNLMNYLAAKTTGISFYLVDKNSKDNTPC